MPLRVALNAAGRWFYLLALPLAMTTPRVALGSVHLTMSDALAALGGTCWLIATAVGSRRGLDWGGAKWPAIVVIAGIGSMIASASPGAAALGVVELSALWILPALAVPNLFDSPRAVDRLLVSTSLGSVIAAVVNLRSAAGIGFAEGIPQVWGPADYLQGYFQVIGVGVAIPRLMTALASGRAIPVVGWGTALFLNGAALLVTQTRGAWLAGVAVLLVLVLLSQRPATWGMVAIFTVAVLLVGSADWAEVIRERAQSIFSFEERFTGFQSSLIRLALALTAVRMFLAHPFVGVGLKNFPIRVTEYAPPGLPDAVEMGPNHLLTLIEGPHSTYLSLLAEAGILAAIGLIGWEIAGARRLFKEYRQVPQAHQAARARLIALTSGVTVVAVFNCFSEMNATGALPLVCFLSLACAASVTEGNPARGP